MAAAMAGAKAKKKKWNKGKMHEKMNAKILFDDESWQRLETEVPKVSEICISCFCCLVVLVLFIRGELISHVTVVLLSLSIDEIDYSLRPCGETEN